MGLAALIAPSAASAATQIGQLPTGDPEAFCPAGRNQVQSSIAAGTPYEVPAEGGVITSWQHRGDMTTPGSGRLQVWRRAGGTSFSLVGRSELEVWLAGELNSFPTQIPVSGGDLLGLRTHTSSDGCAFNTFQPADRTNFQSGASPDPAPGELRNLMGSMSGFRMNVTATLESDCDMDGLGDETQDPTTSTCHPLMLTLNANRNKVPEGRRVTFTGQLNEIVRQGPCESGQPVQLQRKKPSKTTFTTVEQLQTDAAGAFSAKEKVKKTFEYRAQVAETATCAGQTSNTEKVKVKKPK
jgi:hypothetical protein